MPLHIPPLPDVLPNPKQHAEQKEKFSSKSHRHESKHSQQSTSKTKDGSRSDNRASESKDKSPKKDDRSSSKCSKSGSGCEEQQLRTVDHCVSANIQPSYDISVKHTCSNALQMQGQMKVAAPVEDKLVSSKTKPSDNPIEVSAEPPHTKIEVS